jgi:S-adenosylmethionine synthetase
MGDDRQAGCGNRINGLMIPYRPLSLEAMAGNSPVSHTGTLYTVLAHLMAQRIHAAIDAVQAVNVLLLSAIGQPVDQPQIASMDILAAGGSTPDLQRRVHAIADHCLANHQEVTCMLLSGEVGIGSA